MGTSIGQTPAALARLDEVTVRRRARAGEERLSGQAGRGRAEEPEVRAGFGAGTLSTQSAALKTVSTNLQRARELLPTVEELQARARAAAAAAEAARLEEASAPQPRVAVQDEAPAAETPTLVTARPQAEPRARLFAEEASASANDTVVRDAPTGEENAVPTASQRRDGVSALLDIFA